MKYELKKERNKRDIISQYVRENIPGLSKAYYLKLEKQDDVDATIVYTMSKYCGFTLPDDFHKYSIPSLRMNCYIKKIITFDFFDMFAEKTGMSYHWIKRKWIEDKYISLYDYKDAIDEILGEVYVPCCVVDDTIKFYGEPNNVFPVADTLYYCWRLHRNNTVLKEGIIAAKSKESAEKKLNEWYCCNIDEFFHVYASTNVISEDIGIFEKNGIEFKNSYKSLEIVSNSYDDVYVYNTDLLKMNCTIIGMKKSEMFTAFKEKVGDAEWMKNEYWSGEKDISLDEYKKTINEIFGELYIPCIYEGDTARHLNKDIVFPVMKNRFYGWKLCNTQTNTLLKQGIIVAKSEKTALNKLNKWYICKEDESFGVDCATKELDADVGVF